MSRDHIATIALTADCLLDPGEQGALPGMPALVSELSEHSAVLALCPDEATAQRVREAYAEGAPWVRVVEMSGRAEDVAPGLIEGAGIEPAKTLVIDAAPRRCLRLARTIPYVGVFVDAERLYRDLGLWGILPLEHSLARVRHHLAGRRASSL